MASQLSFFHTANELKSTIRQRVSRPEFLVSLSEDNNEEKGSKMLF
ncbi:hypothetical protein DJ60_445 [Yersinia enterocolitica]|nr:hypothetical protein DJ59_389 [Yersinia enterocolitica]KGA76978.1 hypothetical protein DJ60_445 [Yersinia enterocolitica]